MKLLLHLFQHTNQSDEEVKKAEEQIDTDTEEVKKADSELEEKLKKLEEM